MQTTSARATRHIFSCEVLVLLVLALTLGACSKTTSPYPGDQVLIDRFQGQQELFASLVSDPQDSELLQRLGALSCNVSPSGSSFALHMWRTAFIGGGCEKGYVYFAEAPAEGDLPGQVVTDIDHEVGDEDGCGPKELQLHRKLDDHWYLFYSSWN